MTLLLTHTSREGEEGRKGERALNTGAREQIDKKCAPVKASEHTRQKERRDDEASGGTSSEEIPISALLSVQQQQQENDVRRWQLEWQEGKECLSSEANVHGSGIQTFISHTSIGRNTYAHIRTNTRTFTDANSMHHSAYVSRVAAVQTPSEIEGRGQARGKKKSILAFLSF